jgi:hypothetical protein
LFLHFARRCAKGGPTAFPQIFRQSAWLTAEHVQGAQPLMAIELLCHFLDPTGPLFNRDNTAWTLSGSSKGLVSIK